MKRTLVKVAMLAIGLMSAAPLVAQQPVPAPAQSQAVQGGSRVMWQRRGPRHRRLRRPRMRRRRAAFMMHRRMGGYFARRGYWR